MRAPNDLLIEGAPYECPFCDVTHPIEIRKRLTQSLVKNEPVEYEQIYYYCPIEDEEFTPSRIMDQNLLKARDAYRSKKGLLTSEDIKEIRKSYSLTQKEFSNLLGWGDITVQRYETKLIQDATYDNMMKMVAENPSFALKSLDSHKNFFQPERYSEIRALIKLKIKDKGNYLLRVQEIKNYYIDYEEESDSNGYKILNLDRINGVLGYFAKFVNPYKVKMMKLLWYTDALHFKWFGTSMTGLVYQHLSLGAVPLGYNELLSLPSVKVEEKYNNDYISYRIYSLEEINLSSFSLEELNILQSVANFFRDKKTDEVINYMHEEAAYRETIPNQVIPYSLAKKVREFESKYNI
ncbi:MAG: type II TA system antitoxin MqsA family protein [Desulfotomaculaceae bacterium]